MSILGFQNFFQGEGDSTCSTITIGDINFAGGAIPTVGTSITGGAEITGGAAPYTLGSNTLSIPGLTVSVNEFAGIWYVVLSGTPTTFGQYSGKVSVIDDNNCESDLTTFKIDVWQTFTQSVSTPIVGGAAELIINVSGLPTVLGTDVAIDNVKLNLTSDDLSASYVYAQRALLLPYFPYWQSNDIGDLAGTHLTNTVFKDGVVNLISAASDPYTGNFSPTEVNPLGYSVFDTRDPNTNWYFEYYDDNNSATGTFTSVSITFKPI